MNAALMLLLWRMGPPVQTPSVDISATASVTASMSRTATVTTTLAQDVTVTATIERTVTIG